MFVWPCGALFSIGCCAPAAPPLFFHPSALQFNIPLPWPPSFVPSPGNPNALAADVTLVLTVHRGIQMVQLKLYGGYSLSNLLSQMGVQWPLDNSLINIAQPNPSLPTVLLTWCGAGQHL